MALSIDAPEFVEVTRSTPVPTVEVGGAVGHVDVQVHCQFGTLTMTLEKMPTGCHIEGSGSNTVKTGGQQVDVNNVLASLTYHYPDCYQPDSITFQATQPQPTPAAQAEVTKVEIKVEAPAK